MAIKLPVLDRHGQGVGEHELPSDIFERPVNVGLMHQAYVRQMANARLGTHATQSRGQVTRTKSKWYRQKGTGRARHGSRNAPIFVGGGVAHGPQPRSYAKDMPKRMRQEAIRSALSAKVASDGIVLVDNLELDTPKTRDMADILYNLAGDASVLILLADSNENVQRSVRNLPDARYLRANYLNIRDLLKYDKVIIPLNALDVITEWLGNSRSE